MALLSVQEILRLHGITYVESRRGKFTTDCPHCGNAYLNVETKRDGVVWFCQHCQDGGGDKFEHTTKGNGGGSGGGLGPIKDTYDYTDEQGNRLFQVLRFEPAGTAKQFRQRQFPDQWPWSIKGVRIVPFRLPSLIEAVACEHVVLVVEGEKDVLTLARHGIVATCNPMGAGKWRLEFNDFFEAADVVIAVDNDAPGRDHGQLVGRNLLPVAKRVRLLDIARYWPQAAPSDDVSDWFAAGGSAERLWEIIEQLPDFVPEAPKTNGSNVLQFTGAPNKAALPELQTKAEFLAALTPPEYLIENILQRGYIYALTGLTQAGKTAVALLIAQLVSSIDPNAKLGRYKAEKGRVIYFVGENPDEVRLRVKGMDKKRTDDTTHDNITFIPGVFDISAMAVVIEADLKINGPAMLIVVDTSAAYFQQDDENSNALMGAYARMLRSLTKLTGHPTVLVLCHPPKHVDEASKLVPRGGGAYLNEMDANLTLWLKSEDVAELSYTKLRGQPFVSINFQLEKIPNVMTDKTGKYQIGTVRAVVISKEDEEKAIDTGRTDENKLLAVMLKNPDGSTRRWAEELGWFYGSGVADHSRVDRMLRGLITQKKKLVFLDRKKWGLTDEGKKLARDVGAAIQRVQVAEDQKQMDFQPRKDGLRPISPTQTGEVTLQVIGPEPPGSVCEQCGKTHGQVYLIRSPSQGVDSFQLHEACAATWFLKMGKIQ